MFLIIEMIEMKLASEGRKSILIQTGLRAGRRGDRQGREQMVQRSQGRLGVDVVYVSGCR